MKEEILKEAQKLAEKPMTQISLIVMETIADNIIKDKEIDRLNNIINELERWLNKMLPIREMQDLQLVLNKLKELKENK